MKETPEDSKMTMLRALQMAGSALYSEQMAAGDRAILAKAKRHKDFFNEETKKARDCAAAGEFLIMAQVLLSEDGHCPTCGRSTQP